MAERLLGPPALILGGDEIGLSVARSLGRLGVQIFALAPPSQLIRHSRYAQWIPLPGGTPQFWKECANFLIGPASKHLAGAVLLATQDEAVALLAKHRQILQRKFFLDRSNPAAQRTMLDKIATYKAAREAGVPTPHFWIVRTRDELRAVSSELTYPLIVKPRHSHLFKPRFKNAKHIRARNLGEADQALELIAREGLEAFLVETIPGPDSLLCSYYTWLDETGRPWFNFTKRIIRRYPKNMGQATYHVTDDVPGIRELALRLFRHVGLQGLANVEFKLDPRDGEHKLIECNARFTGGNPLVFHSGVNIAELVYCKAIGRPPREITDFRKGVRMWDPWRDFAAYRELHASKDLNLPQWLFSLLHPQTFPVWSWRDPGPATLPVVLWPVRKFRTRHKPRGTRTPV
jgi:D-aspartate ligase